MSTLNESQFQKEQNFIKAFYYGIGGNYKDISNMDFLATQKNSLVTV